MRAFFKSPGFKVFLGIFSSLIIIMVVMGLLGGWASPQSSVAGAAATPLQKFTTGISNGVGDFFSVFKRVDHLEKENAELKEKANSLTSELIDYQKALDENAFYRQFLDLKEEHTDFEFQPSKVIARDTNNQFGSFTIDQGSLMGISPYDPVITADGLVGYVETVAPTYSTVVTVLSPELKAGAFDRRTRDNGILSGSITVAKDGLCRLSNLQRDCSVTIGDYIVTSGGGGIFPEGLVIGTVSDIKQDSHDILVHAIIKPTANIKKLRDVMVITSFSGQVGLGDRIK